jgi:hypothetical protein
MERFLERICTVVMGRGTYDFLEKDPAPWGYEGKRVFVVTSRPLVAPKGALEVRADVDALISELRASTEGDVWMAGGGQLQMAFLERHSPIHPQRSEAERGWIWGSRAPVGARWGHHPFGKSVETETERHVLSSPVTNACLASIAETVSLPRANRRGGDAERDSSTTTCASRTGSPG